MVDAVFYRAFEDRHRGSRELIKSRLTVYLPFILPLQMFYKTCQGIDLGCGRGEWLELMQENGMDVQGVDLDQGMLDVARERGLKVSQADAIQYLQSLASESQMLVSGFHLAEHLPFELLQSLIQESLRVLKSGGLLILETPNPENIVVGTANFYVDPTHQRPIPSQLLSFMTEYAGFEKVKTLRLQEPPELAGNNALNLLSVLNGVSPDYAIVAQKKGTPEIIAAMALAFEADYGLSLESLANSYDQQIKTKAQQAEAKAQQAEAALIAIHNSSSWRLTAPLRIIGSIAKNLFHFPKVAKSKIKEKIKLLLAHTKLYINRSAKLKRLALIVLAAFPALKKRLRQTTYPSHSYRTQPSVAKSNHPSALREELIRAATRWQLGRRVHDK